MRAMKLPVTRRLRFSLRALLGVFTLAALWLGWNVHVVQQRAALLESLRTMRTVDVYTTTSCTELEPEELGRPEGMSLIRYWLGDESVTDVCFYVAAGSVPPIDYMLAKDVFPEADVYQEHRGASWR
jgi:hypothetical protein